MCVHMCRGLRTIAATDSHTNASNIGDLLPVHAAVFTTVSTASSARLVVCTEHLGR